ncbi:hypothetical protein [Actinoplanes philippinensis]|uniref:hypothetical protein n=1 Tax=Actinoplanes philippinensis TaxID=35752 RepID=UPI0033F81C9D
MDEILHLLRNETFTDLLVPGFMKNDDPERYFQLLFDSVYLQVGIEERYLRLSAVNQGDQLKIGIADAIEHDSVLTADDETTAGVASLAEIYFGEAESLPCVSARFLLDANSSVSSGVVKFAEFVFAGDQCISFDPLWTFGVRLGSGGVGNRYRKGISGAYGYEDEYRWSSESEGSKDQ